MWIDNDENPEKKEDVMVIFPKKDIIFSLAN
jgi:hypothetical protein